MKATNKLEQFKSKTAMLLFLDVLFLFLPGVLAIFLYKNDLFIQLDWVKLALLSASIIAPFVFANTLFMMVFEKAENPTIGGKDDDLFYSMSLSVVVTGFTAYIFLLVCGFLKISVMGMIYIAIIIEFIVGMRAWWVERKIEKKK